MEESGPWHNDINDLVDSFNPINVFKPDNDFVCLDSSITDVFKQQPRQDITKQMDDVVAGMNPTVRDT